MNHIDKLLFEQKFNIRNNAKRYGNDPKLDFIINLVLNSIEFTDSKLKISDNTCKGNLLSFYVTSRDNQVMNAKFSGTYYVTDGKNYENRTLEGSLVIKEDQAFLVYEITRLTDTGFITVELGEIFRVCPEKYSYYRFSDYSVLDEAFITYIHDSNFEKVKDFKEQTLKLMRNDI